MHSTSNIVKSVNAQQEKIVTLYKITKEEFLKLLYVHIVGTIFS
jgi:hypothetical protein